MITESNVKLNVSKLNVLKDIFAKQKDSNSRFLNCLFFDGDGRRFVPVTQGNVVINAERSDGSYRSFVGSINDDGSVRVPLTNWMLDKAGDLVCSVTVYEGAEKLTTAAFQIFVQKAENPDGAISPDDPATDVAQQLVLRAEAAVNEIENKFEGAGVSGTSYETVCDVTVTTESDPSYPKPLAKLLNRQDVLYRYGYYRITIDNVQYILQNKPWFVLQNNGRTLKGTSVLGNITYYGDDVSRGFFLQNYDDVPFLICTNVNDDEAVWILTASSGTYTVKVEHIVFDQTIISDHLVYGQDESYPINKYDSESGYASYNIGINRFTRTVKRGNIAVGYGNTVGGNISLAIGTQNNASGALSYCFGSGNEATGQMSVAIGQQNHATGTYSIAVGDANTASGIASHSDGYKATASGSYSGSHGRETIANHSEQHAYGAFNEADDSAAAATARGNYVEIVGNGTDADHRSNARTLDWSGNESLAGSITLGKGTADEVTLTAAQLKRLIALLS